MNAPEPLLRATEAAARRAAAELEALAGEGLAGETKNARELCALLRDALALEKELRGAENAALTVRFEGGTEEAAG